MKSTFFLFVFIYTFSLTHAQQKAVTENGDEVILYGDNTWEYVYADDEELNIPTNDKVFKKGEASTFLLKCSKVKVGFWLDPKLWSFKKATENPDAEYELQLKDGDLYGMILAEKIEIPLVSLRSIALENGRMAAPDLKVMKEEYRTVNGLNVLFMQMNGTMQGIKFSYYGYYFTSSQGTVQFITYTSQNLLKEYVDDCELLLNGIVELD